MSFATADTYEKRYAKWEYADLPILPENWQFSISKGKEKQMKVLKDLVNRKDVTVITSATDAGREGRADFSIGVRKNQLQKTSKTLVDFFYGGKWPLRRAFRTCVTVKITIIFTTLLLCRAKADWIVGINATRLFSVLYGQTLNVGRVMSPTLAMIVEQ